MSVHERFKFPCKIAKETEKAYLLRVPENGDTATFPEQFMERWVPKSQVEIFDKVEPAYVSIPRWLAEKMELM